ncbi:MAG: hypothetical protein A2W52_03545 [Candidatus Taylorbacteria bacterium RIFCSPHIGHO2_02_49_25]|uniref:Uncharacterized protein n=1 Tax=Candidatus Taylorbacteria bacterium RIFCSPHIGHO2_02_49_25 TaxID=1802305 RepID=A0A1G2MDC5_9BACT|nr:MAG: hypothetical protein A2W52_03545 [Candidatus Taylorbacteria bacterium RIFCSPHIGHO2_02_49_25]OHA37556.1 MAG: hypothetical protein A2W65_03000 [Candidatus Taylorbacteria bacterium RIFCSPLOWO2_02_50_13]OHA42120.1 MAG: hypothetical protein A3H73_02560 [Candidatus Taylorbacteria bacterium RIFCSPLOWO2_02_FULL_50_120]OHA47925.1 MAG: hypothetical protein A3G61_02095 [Candidatus Taylorbacteria bacterium RIFCSPLOWO2_12_FULL_49_67]
MKLSFDLKGERVFLQIFLQTDTVLFRTTIIAIFAAPTPRSPLRSNHGTTLAATKKTGERKIMRHAAMPRTRSLFQSFLHSFKQGRRKNWHKASGEKFALMFCKSQIRAIGKQSRNGSFAKWRSGQSGHAMFGQKLRQ